MVMEKARRNKDWTEYIGRFCKLVYEDGIEDDGSPHYSTKKGKIEKVTKTHIILKEVGKRGVTAINLFKVLRIEIADANRG